MKLHILFPFRSGPFGGSNQFLSALREELRRTGHYSENLDHAKVVLFDSFVAAPDVIAAKRRYPRHCFIHRLDGPVSGYRGRDLFIDKYIYSMAHAIADGVIFQSEFSRRENLALGMPPPRSDTIILNAPSAAFGDLNAIRASEHHDRIRLIASSWSSHINKGFDVYDYLDRNLDFTRYEMTFVGNSPIVFRNIRMLPPLLQSDLARELRRHDIFVTASKNDPCSNSLAEALASGLPAVALHSGGHGEIIGGGGRMFTGTADVIATIEGAAEALPTLRSSLPHRTIATTATDYLTFAIAVHRSVQSQPKILTALDAATLWAGTHWMAARTRLGSIATRLTPRSA